MAKKGIPNPNNNPYRLRNSPASNNPKGNPGREFIDFEAQRICPACGRVIKISHNFCKYCGVDLSEIDPIGSTDEISKQLAITAVTDPSADVRKEAVDTLGNFGEKKVLGVLTYVLLSDPSEEVRKEAADELGDLHHPYSLEALTLALKDESPIVRKEAIEGLKKIKKKVKEKKMEKGKPSERQREEDKEEEFEEELEEKVEEEDDNPEEYLL